MLDLLQVVMPVFLIVGAGYIAVWRNAFSEAGTEALMIFSQRFAIPCLLFMAISTLDIRTLFDWRLLLAFYAGTVSSFVIGALLARHFFGRNGPEAVTVGFSATFSNTVLLGLPIVDRAFGDQALDAAFTIITFHAAICYFVGISTMETVLAAGEGDKNPVIKILKAMFSNPLMIGISLGIIVNLSGIMLPEYAIASVEFMSRAALGTALFALGGVLVQYQLSERWGEIAMVTMLRLIWHPLVAFILADQVFDLPIEIVRGIVITAAMAPGVNTFVFANMYDRGKGTAASTILIGTALSVLSVSVWLYILS